MASHGNRSAVTTVLKLVIVAKGRTARWLITAVLAAVSSAALAIPALAKEESEYAPLTIRIIGADDERSFDVVSTGDQAGVSAFIERVGDSVLRGRGTPVGLPAPGLTDYYELALVQGPNAVNRLPWYGMPIARFFFYPARGSVPAYLRIRIARVSEPAHDAWLKAGPSLIGLVDGHRDGLAPVHPRPRPASEMPVAVWLTVAAAFLIVVVLLARLSSRCLRVTPRFGARPAAVRHAQD